MVAIYILVLLLLLLLLVMMMVVLRLMLVVMTATSVMIGRSHLLAHSFELPAAHLLNEVVDVS